VQWFAEKGYGFIKPDHRGADNVFLHVSQLSHQPRATRGSVVTFQSTFDRVKRSDMAYNVHVVVDAVDSTIRAFGTNSNMHPPTQYSNKRYFSPSSPSRGADRRTHEHHGACIQCPCNEPCVLHVRRNWVVFCDMLFYVCNMARAYRRASLAGTV
jgi:cold shock CspA family protein